MIEQQLNTCMGLRRPQTLHHMPWGEAAYMPDAHSCKEYKRRSPWERAAPDQPLPPDREALRPLRGRSAPWAICLGSPASASPDNITTCKAHNNTTHLLKLNATGGRPIGSQEIMTPPLLCNLQQTLATSAPGVGIRKGVCKWVVFFSRMGHQQPVGPRLVARPFC